MNKQTFISIVALLAAPTLLIGGLRGTGFFNNSGVEPTVTQPQLRNAISADEPVDMTARVLNPRMEEPGTGGWFDTGTKWSTAYTGSNFRIYAMGNEKGEAVTTNMVERWWGGGLPTGDAIYQEITDLPNGQYELRMAAMIGQKPDNAQVLTANATVFAGETEITLPGENIMHYYSLETEVTNHSLRIGLRVKDGNNAQWSGLTDVSLTYLGGQRGILRHTYNEAQTIYKEYGITDDGLESLLADANALLADEGATAADCKTTGDALESRMQEYRLQHASAAHPYDMTELLANPTFDAANTNGWTQEGYSGEGGYPKYGAGAIEYWHCTFDLHQTVTGLRDGLYRVSAQLAATIPSNVQLYADDLSANAARQLIEGTDNLTGTGDRFASNREDDRASVAALVLDGELRLGMRTSALDTWIVFDDFRLEFLGETLEIYAEEVAKLADEARAMLDGEAPAQVKAELEQAVATADALTPASGMEAYKQLIPVLNTAMERMATASTLYPAYADIVEAIENMLKSTAASDAHTALETALQASAQRIDASADVTIYATETVTLKEAARAFVVSKPTLLDGQALTVSFMLDNPTFDAANTDGWTIDGYTGQAGYPRFGGGAAEFWHAAFDLNQTVTDLPDGQYRVSAQVAATLTKDVEVYANEISGNPDLYLSNGQTLDGVGDGFATYREDNRVTLGLSILGGESLKLGLRTEATDGWVVFDDFRLEYLGEKLEYYAEELAHLAEKAQGMLGMDATAQVKAALKEALATADALNPETNTMEEYKAAITALREAMAQMDTSGGMYPAYAEMLAACQALLDATDDNAARQVFEAAMQASADRLDATTDAKAYEAEVAALDAARRTFIAAGPDVAAGQHIDLTFLVQNPECTATGGWNPGKTGGNFQSLSNAEKNGGYAGSFIEKWDPTVNYHSGETPIYQNINGLPEGVYSLRAAAFRTNSSGESPRYSMQLFLNNGGKLVAGDQLDYVATYGLVDAGDNHTVTIGLRTTLDNQANWCGIADVTLLYWGSDTEAYEAYRQDVAQELADVTADIELNEGYAQMATQALEDNAATGTDDAESLKAKITALENALQATYESIVPYEAYLAAEQTTRALASNSDGGDRATFEQGIEACHADGDAATTRAALESLPARLESLRQTYMLSGSRPLHGTRFDLSFAVPNMDFAQGLDGWQTDLNIADGENFRTLTNEEVNSQYAGTFAERYYLDDSRLAEAVGKRAMFRIVSGMPVGLYSLEAAAFGQRVWIGDGERRPGMISLYLNNESADIQGTKLDYMSTYSTLCVDGNLEFGLRTEEDNTQNWLGLGDVHLYYYGIPDLFLDSRTYSPISHDTYAHVYLRNEFEAAHWNTLCLPFNVTAEDQAAYFAEVREITGLKLNGTVLCLTTAPATQMLAGKPYLVKTATEAEEITFENMHVLAAAPQAVPASWVAAADLASDSVRLITSIAPIAAKIGIADGRRLSKSSAIRTARPVLTVRRPM